MTHFMWFTGVSCLEALSNHELLFVVFVAFLFFLTYLFIFGCIGSSLLHAGFL